MIFCVDSLYPSMNLSLRVVAGNLLQVSCTLEVPVTLAVTTE